MDEQQRLLISGQMYRPIRKYETRLLRLHAGSEESPLEGNLCHAVFLDTSFDGVLVTSNHSLVTYEALSYTWGEPLFTRLITLDGFGWGITENLAEALKCLRWRHEDRYMWIDAICINQLDLEEKARQIRNMYLCYMKAAQTIVWLGLPDEGTQSAVDSLIVHIREEYSLRVGTRQPAFLPVYDFAAQDAGSKAFDRLMARSWMQRLWILQEVHASSRISVRYGRAEMDWNRFVALPHSVRYSTRSEECSRNAVGSLNLLDDLSDRKISWAKQDGRYSKLRLSLSLCSPQEQALVKLCYLLASAREHQVSVPHDRVYSLLSIASIADHGSMGAGSGVDNIPLDYSIPLRDLYIRLMDQILTVLFGISFFASTGFKHELPSDVPSWVQPFVPDPTHLAYRLGLINRSLGLPLTQHYKVSLESGILTLHGHMIARITGYFHGPRTAMGCCCRVPSGPGCTAFASVLMLFSEVQELDEILRPTWAVVDDVAVGDIIVQVPYQMVFLILRALPTPRKKQFRYVGHAKPIIYSRMQHEPGPSLNPQLMHMLHHSHDDSDHALRHCPRHSHDAEISDDAVVRSSELCKHDLSSVEPPPLRYRRLRRVRTVSEIKRRPWLETDLFDTDLRANCFDFHDSRYDQGKYFMEGSYKRPCESFEVL